LLRNFTAAQVQAGLIESGQNGFMMGIVREGQSADHAFPLGRLQIRAA
jgi:hypothetical protein